MSEDLIDRTSLHRDECTPSVAAQGCWQNYFEGQLDPLTLARL